MGQTKWKIQISPCLEANTSGLATIDKNRPIKSYVESITVRLASTFKTLGLGQVVSMLALSSDYPSLNPAEGY